MKNSSYVKLIRSEISNSWIIIFAVYFFHKYDDFYTFCFSEKLHRTNIKGVYPVIEYCITFSIVLWSFSVFLYKKNGHSFHCISLKKLKLLPNLYKSWYSLRIIALFFFHLVLFFCVKKMGIASPVFSKKSEFQPKILHSLPLIDYKISNVLQWIWNKSYNMV